MSQALIVTKYDTYCRKEDVPAPIFKVLAQMYDVLARAQTMKGRLVMYLHHHYWFSPLIVVTIHIALLFECDFKLVRRSCLV